MLEPRKMITEREVLDLVPVARSTLRSWVDEGSFPRPVRIGPARIAWFADEVAAWQEERRDG